jgi:hypothetical protein
VKFDQTKSRPDVVREDLNLKLLQDFQKRKIIIIIIIIVFGF